MPGERPLVEPMLQRYRDYARQRQMTLGDLLLENRIVFLEGVINDAVANLIRKGKAFQIPAVVATAREAGMQSMDVELRRLVREGVIPPEEAYMRAVSKKEFEEEQAPPPAPAAPVASPTPAGRPGRS